MVRSFLSFISEWRKERAQFIERSEMNCASGASFFNTICICDAKGVRSKMYPRRDFSIALNFARFARYYDILLISNSYPGLSKFPEALL